MVLAGVIAAWVIADAMRRGKSSSEAFLWGLGVFCLCCVFLPIYLFARSEQIQPVQRTTLCRYCGLYSEGDPTYCSHCGKRLKEPAIFKDS